MGRGRLLNLLVGGDIPDGGLEDVSSIHTNTMTLSEACIQEAANRSASGLGQDAEILSPRSIDQVKQPIGMPIARTSWSRRLRETAHIPYIP